MIDNLYFQCKLDSYFQNKCYRFIVNKKNEETLGELFIFFMLETILIGKAMGVNPYDQPAVELIKKETKNLLIQFFYLPKIIFEIP